jgi:hypothetical protein
MNLLFPMIAKKRHLRSGCPRPVPAPPAMAAVTNTPVRMMEGLRFRTTESR